MKTIEEIRAMSDEDKIRKIAEICGWTDIFQSTLPKTRKAWLYGTSPPKRNAGCRIPNYLEDLNACHEMVKTLDLKQIWKMHDSICEIRDEINQKKLGHWYDTPIFTLSARHYVEAFLMTVLE